MKTVSVIVVSHGRSEALKRCLIGLGQLYYPEFEIVVVADAAAVRVIGGMPMAERIKLHSFEDQNISAARNLGIAQAAGDIVAFVDDDAVPEPTWLCQLAGAFEDDEVAAAGGFVRGRNGVSWQYRANSVDHGGRVTPLELGSEAAVVLHPAQGRAIKTEGTNMAFRRDILAGMGGFDPAFRFFLDETDVNLRLADAGHATALVPMAEVHHGFAESARRRQDRVPRDLFEIGASHTAFLLRHAPEAERAQLRAAFREEQRVRLLRHMVAGRLEPRDVRRLLARLESGFAAGQERAPHSLAALPRAAEGFKRFPRAATPAPKIVSGRWRNRGKLRQQAEHHVAAGHVTTVMVFSLTAVFGHVMFTNGGYWEHRGGQFGKMTRTEPLFRLRSLRGKVAAELRRIQRQRGITALLIEPKK